METRKNFLDREIDKSTSIDGGSPPASDDDCTHGDGRRVFLAACSTSLIAAASQWLTTQTALALPAVAGDPSKRKTIYAASILTDEQGRPIRAASIKPLVNYVFHYPYLATPCLLLNMGRDVGGVGRRKSIVAYSAICSHKLAYPAKEVSFIRFQASPSAQSEAERIHCCADHSVYDPAVGAKVVSGPAPVALAAIALEHDAATDTLKAVGTAGVEQFEAFFAKYEFKLGMEFGNKARHAAAGTTRLQELTQFCRNVAQC
jgi:arsenite oxidase small subunit